MSKSKNTIKISCRGGSLQLAMKEKRISAHSFFGKTNKVSVSDIQKARKVAEELMNRTEIIPHPTLSQAFVLVHGYADSGVNLVR